MRRTESAVLEDLVRRCTGGNARAWSELVDRYSRLVYSIPRRYGLEPADAEDVMQAVFVTAYRSIGQLKDPSRLPAWLITTAHRESWRVGRARGMGRELGEAIGDLDAPAQDRLERWEEQDRVDRALGELGGACERLLRALYYRRSESSYQAIAEELGMPVGSIGPTRARCLRKLQELLVSAVGESSSTPTTGR